MTEPRKDPRKPDASRRSERSRLAILTASLDQVTDVGYAKTTIEAIAARAGVGKQTIYRWWPSKGALVFDALLHATASDSMELPDTGDIEADLKNVLRATVDEFADPRLGAMLRALNTEVQHDAELAQRNWELTLRPAREAYANRLRAAQQAGQVAGDIDVEVAVDILTGPLFHRWLLRTAPLTHAYTDTVVDLTLRGIRPA